jgi:hypothetical protein
MRIYTIGILAAFLAFGCNKKDSDDSNESNDSSSENEDENDDESGSAGTLSIKESGEVEIGVAALNSLSAYEIEDSSAQSKSGSLSVGSSLNSSSAALTTADEAPDFTPDSITSGPPDGFRLKIKSISLEGDSGRTTIFKSDEGAEISIDSGSVDLSALLKEVSDENTDESDESLKFRVKPGKYDTVAIKYFSKSYIKGCVSGNFADHGNGVGGTGGEHTYCTQEGKSPYDGETAQNADFENKTAEWMAFKITGDDDNTFSQDYEIPDGFSVDIGESTKLTMVIDMNRLLRFYNRGRLDQGPNPSYSTEYSYFFDSTFSNSTYVFAGEPGGIYGYQLTAIACSDENYISETESCPDDNNFVVGLWLTVITAQGGGAISANFMPDDDNTFTVIKGGNRGIVGDFIEANGSNVDIKYTLGEGSDGKIVNFPADLNAASVGDDIEGVTFDGFQDNQGPVFVSRRL